MAQLLCLGLGLQPLAHVAHTPAGNTANAQWLGERPFCHPAIKRRNVYLQECCALWVLAIWHQVFPAQQCIVRQVVELHYDCGFWLRTELHDGCCQRCLRLGWWWRDFLQAGHSCSCVCTAVRCVLWRAALLVYALLCCTGRTIKFGVVFSKPYTGNNVRFHAAICGIYRLKTGFLTCQICTMKTAQNPRFPQGVTLLLVLGAVAKISTRDGAASRAEVEKELPMLGKSAVAERLSLLVHQGLLNRVGRGVYACPLPNVNNTRHRLFDRKRVAYADYAYDRTKGSVPVWV